MPDYDHLLDAEMQAYITRCAELYPPDAVDLTIEDQRKAYNTMCAAFDRGRPEGICVQDERHAGLPCRRYDPDGATKTAVYFHGGGFVVGGLESHDSICAELAKMSGLSIVAVDYPLAPEHQFPEDFDASLAAYRAIRTSFDDVCLVSGDSAGGNLAAAISHALRGDPAQPNGQVLIYPALCGDPKWPSYVEHADAPHLTAKDVAFYQHIRTAETAAKQDIRYAPLADKSFAGLPRTVCLTAECDPLTSDSEYYVDYIRKDGGEALCISGKGLIHGCLRARAMSTRAAEMFTQIGQSIRALADGHLPKI